MLVAPAAVSARREKDSLAVVDEVGDFLPRLGVGDDGAERQGNDRVVSGGPVAVRPHPVLSAARAVHGLMAEVVERVEGLVGDGEDRSAVSAVAAGRPAARDELLPAKGDAAVAAV